MYAGDELRNSNQSGLERKEMTSDIELSRVTVIKRETREAEMKARGQIAVKGNVVGILPWTDLGIY
jgi:hypothetical protein